MKKLIFLLLLVSSALYSKDCGWEWSSPLPQGNLLHYVKFASKDVVYAFGKNATIVKSTDSGINWKLISSGVLNYSSPIVIDENTVLLQVGDLYSNKFLKTSDGGNSWLDYTVNVELQEQGCFLFFSLNDIVYYSNSFVKKTSDGGNTWESVPFPETTDTIKQVLPFDLNTSFIFDSKQIFRTTDSGINWLANDLHYSNFFNSYYRIHFINQNTGFFYSLQSGFYRTNDAGASWKKININLSTPIYFMKFLDENTGYFFGLGMLYRTTDGGDSWEKQYSGSSFDGEIQSIDVFEDGFLIGVGKNGYIKRTSDHGYTWVNVRTGAGSYIGDIAFTDKNTGYAVGGSGVILKTTNAGKTWEDISRLDKGFSKIKFFNPDTAIISTLYGEFFKTTDAGENFSLIGSIENVTTRDISFINEEIGWACFSTQVGSRLEFYAAKTTDGGSTWMTKKYFEDTVVNAIHFFNEDIGYAIGRYGVFWKITNDGKDWQTTKFDKNLELQSQYFIDENTGWIAGDQILKTTDAGNTWTLQLDSAEYIQSIHFVNHNYGWAVSQRGAIYNTSNGGESWEFNRKLAEQTIYKIFFLDEENGWVVGSAGTILKYSCTETSVEDNLPISESKDFQIFPNPAQNEITLSIPENQSIYSISIFNSLGMGVKRIAQAKIIGNNKITISTADFPNGLYHCSFVNQADRITKSFVILR